MIGGPLASGTYTTQFVDPSHVEQPIPQKERLEKNPAPVARAESLESPKGLFSRLWDLLKTPTAIAAVSPGKWWGSVTVFTRDPPQLILTQTYTKLAWTVFYSGTVDWNYWDDSCWAANPSPPPGNIHWFISSCRYGGVWYMANYTQVCHDHSGGYYNYDFADPRLRTDVSQWAQICGKNDGYFNYWWNHTDSGEYSSLIYGFVVLNQR